MKPLTMTEGREELIREVVGESVARAESGGTLYAAPLLAEVDALRAALAEERKHADTLKERGQLVAAGLRHRLHNGYCADNDTLCPCQGRGIEVLGAWSDVIAAHAARRAAEKEGEATDDANVREHSAEAANDPR